MGLTLPVVSNELGPAYAVEVNGDFTTLDTHDHSMGKGVPVTPAGLSITADLPFISNNATQLRSVRFIPQGAPLALASDVGCLYEVGGDLYYNDAMANQVRITQAGGVAGSPGSITGLVSPATASYSAGTQTFIWQSDVNTAANLDAGSLVLRNITANSKGLTLNPPASMSVNYSITLPNLPVSQSFMTIDSSGTIAAPATYPLTAAGIASGVLPQLQYQVFATPGDTSFVVPAGASNLIVGGAGAGGGGGSGGSGGANSGGGGGGAGSLYTSGIVIPVTPGETLTIRVGTAGAGAGGASPGGTGNSGGAGTLSAILRGATVLYFWQGGSGGTNGATHIITPFQMCFAQGAAGGAAGIAGGTGISAQGSNGGAGGTASGGGGGGGGGASGYNDGAFQANGGAGGNGSSGGGSTSGGAGVYYGAGGGGGGGTTASGSSTAAGGNGAGGVVTVAWSAPV